MSLGIRDLMRKRLCMLFICCFVVRSVWATSVVVKVEKDRIILAADTRRTMFAELSGSPHDGMCKISVFSKIGFSASGAGVEFHQVSGPPVVGDWSAFEAAKNSYAAHPHSLLEMAEDWKTRTIRFYTTLYSVSRQTVEGLAHTNSENVLIIGIFAGWDDAGRPEVIAERISLDVSHILPAIVGDKAENYERERPYSTNVYTDALADSGSERGKAAANGMDQ